MMMATPIDIDQELSRPFQRLSLAIPIDSKRYMIMCRFFAVVLNLDPTSMYDANVRTNSMAKEEPVELLPNVAFPADIWLMDDVRIKDIKVKSTMLSDISSWMEQELTGASAEVNEESTLSYYEKILQAYNFYEMPSRYSRSSAYSSSSVLMEEDEEDPTTPVVTTPSQKVVKPTVKPAKQTPAPSASSSSSSSKRVSALSREIINSRKRFSTLLGQQQNGSASAPVSAPPPAPVDETDDDKLNNLLSKTKIYSKLKKNRDSTSSMTSQTSGGPSNRNSVSTTISAASSGSRRRSSLMSAFDEPRATPISLVSPEQRKENRKLKLEYYIQLSKLFQISEQILKTLAETKDPKMSNTKLVRFLEFIKKKVFRFVIVDISQMVMDYGQLKAVGI